MHTTSSDVVLPGYKPGIEGNVVEQRRAERFELELPVLVIREGSKSVCTMGRTRNLSSGGALLVMQKPLSIGDRIEFVVMLTVSNKGQQATRLLCRGKVLRNEGFVYAATIERYEFLRDEALAQK